MSSETFETEMQSSESVSSKETIRVVVRIRPFNPLEMKRGDSKIVEAHEDGQSCLVHTSNHGVKRLIFDNVFDEDSYQDAVFSGSGVIELVDKAVEGYATVIFAYGQTGSGKTYTMTGPDNFVANLKTVNGSDAGVIPRAIRYLFENHVTSENIVIRASYLEIYNEQVRDLVNLTKSNLQVRHNETTGFFIENLFIADCDVMDDCLAVLEEGIRNRHKAAHNLNEHSSRSHSIFTVYVETNDNSGCRRQGKISFVDLAGSEKASESKTTGKQLTETMNINKSLLALGNCISALSDAKKKSHIPYRDSKLTKLLSDSLGGNGISLMITCINASSYWYHETIKTLKYAQRAKNIKSIPVLQLDDPKEQMIRKLKLELELARKEGLVLKQAIGEQQADEIISKAFPPRRPSVNSAKRPSIDRNRASIDSAASSLRLPRISDTNSIVSDSRPSTHRQSIQKSKSIQPQRPSVQRHDHGHYPEPTEHYQYPQQMNWGYPMYPYPLGPYYSSPEITREQEPVHHKDAPSSAPAYTKNYNAINQAYNTLRKKSEPMTRTHGSRRP